MSCNPLTPGESGPAAGRALASARRGRRPRRRLLWLLPLALVVTAGVLGGARWLLTAERFAVARIETGPYRFSDPARLEARLGAALGSNIWTGAGARRLAAELPGLPWVRAVRVARELPGTLRVEIEEWRPLLAVAPDSSVGAGPGEFVLLADGRVEPFPGHLPRPDLPLLVGARVQARPDGGWRLAPDQADSVLALAAAVAETGIEGCAPVDFILAGDDGLSLVLQGGRARLLVGGEEYAGRLRRFLALRNRLPDGAVVDLRFERRLFVDDERKADQAPADGGAGQTEESAVRHDRATVAAPAGRDARARAGARV
ncbi:MAG: cell division protein FtsQ/DivIB [Candidatus Krumholzibacteriia bacterium]